MKADAKKSSRFTRTPTPPPVVPVHDQFSSSDESEAEEKQNRAVECSSDDGGMSLVEEIPVPEGLGDDDDEGWNEEEEDFSWKCRLLEFIQQYPKVFDKARNLRDPYRKKS